MQRRTILASTVMAAGSALALGCLFGCSEKGAEPAPSVPFASIIGRHWDEVYGDLSARGVSILDEWRAEDGHGEYILRGTLANVSVVVSEGVIDEVAAWAVNGLGDQYASVAGEIRPGVPVAEIERLHGGPIYSVITGKEGQYMKGWRVGEYLVLIECNGLYGRGDKADRIYAFRQEHLPPSDRIWSLKGRTTLKDLMEGRPYIESR